MKKVLVFGVFDLFHFGHLRLLKRAAKLGDYCIAAVQNDEYILRYKPPGAAGALYSTEERCEMIRALRCVDEVITYNAAVDDIKNIEFDIWVKGPDQDHEGFKTAVKWCEENGKEVVTLPRTEGISSTYIKRLISDFAANEKEKTN
jgi:glycerol-3-phosphate cytidylyltransferase